MKIFTKNCEQTETEGFCYSLFEKVKNNTKLLFSMLLFFGLLQSAFAQGTLVPACNIGGNLEACAVPAGFSDTSGDMIILIEVARSGVGATLTPTLPPALNTSGAIIRSIGVPSYNLALNKTFQTLIVYPGNTGSAFNIEMNVINNQSVPATTCECSKSVSVSVVSADSSYLPITCYGQLTTLTAVGNLSDQSTYTYTLNPGNITNTTGIFPNLPGSEAGILYTVTVVSAEGCVTTTSQTITQPAFNPVVLNCPTDRTELSCQTQTAINAAFNTWLNSFSFTGGTNPVLTRTPSSPNAPLACGGSTEVRWDVTDECGQTQTCVRTFTVTAPPAVVFNCATNVVIPACSSQAAVNTAWANFLASTTASGGCGGLLTNNAPTTPPSACGATREVTFTYTVGSCGQTQSCTRTFTVTPAPQVVFNCGTNVVVPACSTQEAVNLAWTNFLASTTASGGCNGSLTNNASTQQAPSACGGSREVTWTYTVGSCGETQSCTRTFTVTAAPQVVFNCGTNVVVPACSTQEAVNLAWTNFLASTTASGGCNGSLTNNASTQQAPSACGGSREVTWTYTVGSCGQTQSCTRTFTVTPTPQVVFNCGTNVVVPACSTQEAVNLAWTNFLASTTASGGCGGILTNNASTQQAPSACGGSREVTWTYTVGSCGQTQSCTRTFTVTPAPAVEVTAPVNSSANACTYANQDAVDAAFAAWLAQFSVSGGCDPSGSYGEVSAPNACGGSVSVTYTVTDRCYETTNRTRTFEVTPAPAVEVSAPVNSSASACTYANQDAVDAAFAAWLAQFTVSGGCDPSGSYGEVSAPSACGGSVSVTYTVTDKCYETTNRTRTFEVTPAPAVEVSAPVNSSASACTYANQDAVDAAFAAWLAQFTVSGGCDPSGSYGEVSAPNACGGSVSVTYTVTDKCYQTTNRTRTFEVTPAPAVEVSAPANSSASACTYANQDAVDAAFALWLAQFTVSGGCDPSGSYGEVTAPNACGGIKTVTYTVTDKCYQTTTHTATFEVTPAPSVLVGTPVNSTTNANDYADQDAVDAAFAAWLAQFTVSGGCDPSGSYGQVSAPLLCGGTRTVTYTVTDKCYQTTTHTATFTITGGPAVVVNYPTNNTANACTYADQDAADAAFAAWLAEFTVSGGYDPSGSYGEVSAPSACGGTTIVTFTVTDRCYITTNVIRTFVITPAPEVTVGAPANSSANACTYANQAAVNSAYNLWLAQFTVSGGCDPNGVLTFNTVTSGTAPAPSACGGSVTATYTVTDKCYQTSSITRTFEVTPAPAVEVASPSNSSANACTYADQDAVDAAFAAWLAGFNVSGGCDPSGSYGEVSAPNACGGSVSVTYTVTDKCYQTSSITRTFEVTPAPAVEVASPSNSSANACTYADQDAVDAAFAAWLAGFNVSGGCDPSGSYGEVSAPNACGGSVSVTYTVTDKCYQTSSITRTFEVTPAPAVEVASPSNSSANACTYANQDAVDAAFAAWLAGFNVSGGCDPSGSYGEVSAPNACGGSVSVTYTVTDKCYQTSSITRTFEVTPAPAVEVASPSNSSANACTYADQDAVDAAFAAWLAGFNVSGGCDPSGSYGEVSAPNACGGSVSVTYTVTDKCYQTSSITRTFEVTPAPAVEVASPSNSSANACTYADQDAVDAAFAAWLAGFNVSGGCDPSGSYGEVSAPNACGGSVSVTYTVTDKCYQTSSITRTFEVTPAPAVEVASPSNSSANACTYADQDAVDAAFVAWLAGFNVSGGCDPSGSYGEVSAPNACGGSVSVTYTVTDKCYQTSSITRTFEVTPAPAVEVASPSNSSANACTYANQDAVDAAFATWLAGFNVSGGCDPSGSYGEVSAPNACGGSVSVTYTVTDKCYQTSSITRTFEVTPAPAVEVASPSNSSANACTYADQDAVDAAFAAWLAGFNVSGGCDPSGSYGEVSAPNACGGSVSVTYTVTDKCYQTSSITRTFEVTPAPAVVFNCGTNVNIPACSTQAQVNAAWTAFLASTTASGGCNAGTLTNNGGNAPSACGGSKEVTWTYSVGNCGQTQSCTRTFTVAATPAVVFNCGPNVTVPACSTQAQVNAAWTAFIASTTASGGCGGVLTNNCPATTGPDKCGGYRDVTWTYTVGSCGQTQSCTRRFTVLAPAPVAINCGSNVTVPACSTQAQVNAAWTAFLASTTATGGCNGVLTTNCTTPPSACGGYRDVTWTYTVSGCGTTSGCNSNNQVTCTKRFTVLAPAPVAINCGSNVTVPACSTQAQVNAAWTAFLASTTATGGCNGVLTTNCTTPPSACGGYRDVTWTYTVSGCGTTSGCNSNNQVTCTKRFTVLAPPAVVMNCATNVCLPACSTQAQINAAWTAFLASTTATGGCGGVLTNNATTPPSACGGYKDVTWTYTVNNACGTTTGCNSNGQVTCTKRFTVTAPPAVVFNCGNNVTVPACSTQAQVNTAWTAFLASTTASGGCGGVLTNNAPTTAPSACGGYVDVTWTYNVSTACGTPTGCNSNGQLTCTKRFTVAATPAVVMNCGNNVTIPACSTQAQVNAAWTAFLCSTTATGGCNGVLTRSTSTAPSACGGYVDVTWTYTVSNACGSYPTGCNSNGQVTCTKRFTVLAAPAVVMNCGNNVTVPACSTQAQVNAAWTAFLASTTASGGCNGVLTSNCTTAPSACGGYRDVTWTYTVSNACGTVPAGCNSNGQVTCTKRFTVLAAPAVVMNCGNNVTVPACSTQAQINAAWTAFLASTTASGGCNGVLTSNCTTPPSACGGYRDVTWTYTVSNACGTYPTGCNSNGQVTCTKRFTVLAPPAVVLNCGNDVTISNCLTQSQVNAAWASFLCSTTATGGCGGVMTNNAPSCAPAANRCGYVDVTWTYTVNNACGTTTGCNSNGQVSCTKRFRIATSGFTKGTNEVRTDVATDEKPEIVAFDARVYPNPFTESFNLNLTTSSQDVVELVVYDMTGKLIEKLQVNPMGVAELHVGDRYPSGVYNVIVTQGNEVKTLRVIKR